MRTRVLIAGTLCLSVICASITRAEQATSAPAGVDIGIEALRQGRFVRAGDQFALVSREAPQAAEGPFFEAFLLWWRLLDRTSPEEARPLRLAMEERLAETERRAREIARTSDPVVRQRALTFLGTALLLEAQSKVARGAHLSAASAARQGHQALSEVLEAQPDSPDALFAMGVYNYFADKMSAFVKGLRFLLFIPGGDAERGLSQLEACADNSRIFGTESLLLLGHIYSGNFERDFTKALVYVSRAATRHPDSPLIALVRADLLFKLGRLKEASATATGALRMIRSSTGYAPDLEGLAAHRISACTLELHDPLTAMAQAEEDLKLSSTGTSLTRRRFAALLVAAARESGAPERALSPLERLALPPDELESIRSRVRSSRPDPLAGPRASALQSFALGREDQALHAIQALLDEHPDDQRLQYDYGRMLQQQGRAAEAQSHLLLALEGDVQTRHVDIAGWALLRLGWAREAAGERAVALTYYRRASQLKHFTFQAAALDLLDHPALSPPEG